MLSEKIFLQGLLCIMIYQIVSFVATLVANYILFDKVGRKKWQGLIPIVNSYVLFDQFWNRPMFVLYEICYLCSYFSGYLGGQDTIVREIIMIITSLVMLLLLIGLYDRISKAFGKGFLWVLGLAICYPVFAIILAKKYTYCNPESTHNN